MRVSLRLNQKIPEHARIISVLKDLNKKYHTTLNSFVIEALSFYIKNSGRVVTEDILEERLDLYDQALKRWLLDCFVSFSAGANRFPSPVSSAHSFPGEGNTAPKELDLTEYPDIMKDVNAWSED